ncbi:GrpB family protein [Anabaena sphaerica FACHB-251]|uniref:GrpB family protein n=1 Tax=Anabaena sphaerica FACHB-251 TaxID=2692883 RepID=A0A926WHQ1_9NOST|nr:GrpB family protein [Anabaena sphaerica FACHB-251]
MERQLAFRDYMIAHSENAQKYSDLKRELAKKYPDNIESYMDGKDWLIIDRKAAEWRKIC